ncbi:glycoside hydrolase [Litorilinea aerophila]|nr:sugar-binding domain-containing protein [Litorilinea aerophila]MCC9074632.1 glycoside hydrolase [Litorilinea aerophila]
MTASHMDLAGPWAFRLDPEDRGLDEGWYAHPLPHSLQLPGSLQAQGYGNDITVDTPWTGDIFDRSWFESPRYAPYRQPGNIKVPFWLQPEKHYVGPAWYQRMVEIPPHWQGQRVRLFLERPHWETRVWLDDVELGAQQSLSTPHCYELGTHLAPGPHRLTIRVDNRLIVNVGPNAHSVSDHTQGNWNGIVGRLALEAASPVWIEEVQVFPNVARRTALVRVHVGNALGRPGTGQIRLQASAYNTPTPHTPPPVAADFVLTGPETVVHLEYPLGEEAQPWDEFSPALYRLAADLTCRLSGAQGEPLTHGFTTSFGLREVAVAGTQLAVNGRRIFLRGTLECCIFPRTGYPPTDVDSWRRIIQICQAHGLNHIRFHSWCPPEAAFVAADELGFYFQVECAAWANQGATIGEGKPLDSWLYAEGERIVAAYGNHPSFLMMAYGNEPAGRHEEYLGTWLTYWKGRDGRRVYTGGAGWPAIPENHYHNIPQPRIQAWGEGLNSRINARPPETRTDYREHVARLQKPIVSHEIGQWCVYPNFQEIEKYTGHLKARNFEIFRDFLVANHMGDQAQDFLMASGKLQALCYKEEIESALRTPGFAGFQLLDLHDFPGQGTALVGVLDAFWDEKGYITAAEFRRFCNSTVPLARMDRRIWHTGETFLADVELAHFGPTPLADAVVSWRLMEADGQTVAQGQMGPLAVPTGGLTPCGTVQVELAAAAPARKYRLVAGVDGTAFENDWEIWVFPQHLETPLPADLHVAEELDEAALDHLAGGGTVLLMPQQPAASVRGDVALGFSSVFWNTAWTNGQPPHTLGILCDPAHPVFAHFPTEYHSNWQWWELIHGAGAMVLDGLPPALRPLIQPIDTWFEARRLGLLFEARVHGGRLMVCSMDLRHDLEKRLVARQMWHSLVVYLGSPAFDPQVEVPADAIRGLFREPPAG